MNIRSLGGAFILEQQSFHDMRGKFLKIFNNEIFENLGISFVPKEVFYSVSGKNVIRGMHFQTGKYAHTKLVTCIRGAALDVFIDLRKDSKDYGKVFSLEINERNNTSVLIPPGFGHGFLALEEGTTLLYQVDVGYNKEHDGGIQPLSIDFNWPAFEPIISDRDKQFEHFKNFSTPFV